MGSANRRFSAGSGFSESEEMVKKNAATSLAYVDADGVAVC